MPEVLVERRDGVVVLTLNRPEKKNAINRSMWGALHRLLGDISRNSEDRVLIITGAGNAFCAGGDVSEPLTDEGEDPVVGTLAHMRLVQSVALLLHECPMPTIAAVNGVAAGGGLNIALGCDLTVVAEDARLCQVFVRHGLVPDCGGLWILPRLVGLHRAKELALLGEAITAREAAELGLVNRVVAPDQVLPTARGLAERMAGFSPESTCMIKQALNRAFDTSLPAMLEQEGAFQALVSNSDRYRSARDAFLGRSGD